MAQAQNKLAKVRTTMANERTLLSYYRSSIAILGLAAFVFKFYDHWVFKGLSGLFVLVSLLLAIYGTNRFNKKHEKIEEMSNGA